MSAGLALRILAGVPVLSWLYLLLARGGFWRVSRLLTPAPAARRHDRRVVAVIPARNEAAFIGATVESILGQDYAGAIHVIVVDDGSDDDTARVARDAAAGMGASAKLTVIPGAPLPPGWTGKVWAMRQGAAAAAALGPDYLLFTDADIHHDPANIADLVARAEAGGLDLVSYMVTLPAASFAEKSLIPAFVFFFLMLYPPAWIASTRSRMAGAAGGCMLMRPSALARIGGLEAIRSQLIDDCSLARATKAAGGSIWLGLTRTARGIRPYGSFAEIGRMISRSAFNQLGHSYLLLAATVAGLFVTYLLPPLLLLSADRPSALLGAAAWACMSVAYAPMVRFYGRAPLWSLCLPPIALFYAGATVHSALQYALRRGGRWKGRVQDLQDT